MEEVNSSPRRKSKDKVKSPTKQGSKHSPLSSPRKSKNSNSLKSPKLLNSQMVKSPKQTRSGHSSVKNSPRNSPRISPKNSPRIITSEKSQLRSPNNLRSPHPSAVPISAIYNESESETETESESESESENANEEEEVVPPQQSHRLSYQQQYQVSQNQSPFLSLKTSSNDPSQFYNNNTVPPKSPVKSPLRSPGGIRSPIKMNSQSSFSPKLTSPIKPAKPIYPSNVIYDQVDAKFDSFVKQYIKIRSLSTLSRNSLYDRFLRWWSTVRSQNEEPYPPMEIMEEIMIDNGFMLKRSINPITGISDKVWNNIQLQ